MKDKIVNLTVIKEEFNNEIEYVLYGVSENGNVYRGARNVNNGNIYWELLVKSPTL